MGFTPCKAEQPLRGMELQEKQAQKDHSIEKICLERAYSSKVSVNSRLQAAKIIDPTKAFYRQRVPESSCARKKTVDIAILVRMVTKNHAIYQNNK